MLNKVWAGDLQFADNTRQDGPCRYRICRAAGHSGLKLYRNEEEVAIGPLALQMLETLARAAYNYAQGDRQDRHCDKYELYKDAAGDTERKARKTIFDKVDKHLSLLRKRLNDQEERIIETKWGTGYVFLLRVDFTPAPLANVSSVGVSPEEWLRGYQGEWHHYHLTLDLGGHPVWLYATLKFQPIESGAALEAISDLTLTKEYLRRYRWVARKVGAHHLGINVSWVDHEPDIAVEVFPFAEDDTHSHVQGTAQRLSGFRLNDPWSKTPFISAIAILSTEPIVTHAQGRIDDPTKSATLLKQWTAKSVMLRRLPESTQNQAITEFSTFPDEQIKILIAKCKNELKLALSWFPPLPAWSETFKSMLTNGANVEILFSHPGSAFAKHRGLAVSNDPSEGPRKIEHIRREVAYLAGFGKLTFRVTDVPIPCASIQIDGRLFVSLLWANKNGVAGPWLELLPNSAFGAEIVDQFEWFCGRSKSSTELPGSRRKRPAGVPSIVDDLSGERPPHVEHIAPTSDDEAGVDGALTRPLGNLEKTMQYVIEKLPQADRVEDVTIRWNSDTMHGDLESFKQAIRQSKPECEFEFIAGPIADSEYMSALKAAFEREEKRKHITCRRLHHNAATMNFMILFYPPNKKKREVIFGYAAQGPQQSPEHRRSELTMYCSTDPGLTTQFLRMFRDLTAPRFSRKIELTDPDFAWQGEPLHWTDVIASFDKFPSEITDRMYQCRQHISICITGWTAMATYSGAFSNALASGCRVNVGIWKSDDPFVAMRDQAIARHANRRDREAQRIADAKLIANAIVGNEKTLGAFSDHERLTVAVCRDQAPVPIFWIDDLIYFGGYWLGANSSLGPFFLVRADSETGGFMREQFRLITGLSDSEKPLPK